jgi:hypothetical protein
MLFSLPCGSSGSLATTILGFFSAARCFVLMAAFSLLDRSRLRRKEHFLPDFTGAAADADSAGYREAILEGR